MATKKRKPVVYGRMMIPPLPAPPKPGRWRIMQRHGVDVLQWSWACPTCQQVEYVRCDPPRPMEAGSRREYCGKCKGNKLVRHHDDTRPTEDIFEDDE